MRITVALLLGFILGGVVLPLIAGLVGVGQT